MVTALFADVVGSTSLGERLDPEDFTEVVGEAVRGMAVCVERFGGSVSELAGDGLLALFGAPVAHEDDPERAALAGLAIVESATAYAQRLEHEWAIEGFTVRVGLETGLAVLGPVGGGSRVEYGAMGDSLNTAARLQAAAEPGGVLAGPETRRLVSGCFEWGEPRELVLKGKLEPVLAHPVLAPRERPERERGLTGVEAPLVGRESELRLAREALLELEAGKGGVLLVSGEPGVGKTRLLAELRRAVGADVRWLEGRCVSYAETLPYWPFQGVLRDWLGRVTRAPDLREELEAQAQRLLGERGKELSEPLAVMLGLRAAGEDADPELVQRRLHAGFAELVSALAARAPLVIALDDLHWADPSSVALVERLASLARSDGVLLLLAGRPDAGQPFARLRERLGCDSDAHGREIPLQALAQDAERVLLAGLIGSRTLPEWLERRLLERTEGNPFYLEELVRSMVDAGALHRTQTGWRFDRDARVEVPDSVEKVVLSRVDRLAPEAQEMLGAAAVLGRQFSLTLLDRVLSAGGSAGAALAELEAADLVREAGSAGERTLRFKHSLIREAAYRSLLKRRRQQLHARAADALEELYAGRLDEVVGLLAVHCSAAGDDGRALRHHHRAGDAARLINAPEEGIEHYGAALDAAGRLGRADDERLVIELRLRRGALIYELGRDAAAAIRDLEGAAGAARRAGEADLELHAHISLGACWRALDFPRGAEHHQEAVRIAEARQPAALVEALARLAIYLTQALRLRRARELADRALAVARDQGGEKLIVYARDALKLVAQQTGDLDELERLTTMLVEDLRGADSRTSGPGLLYTTDVVLMWALVEGATAPMARGDFELAAERGGEALAMLERTGGAGHEPVFREALCRLGRTRGDYASALEHGRRAMAVAESSTMAEWGAWAAATYAWTLLDLRAPVQARELLGPWARRAAEAGAIAQEIRCLSLLAWADSQAGDAAAAREHRARAQQLLAQVNARPGEAWLFGAHAYFAVARVLLDQGYPERAEGVVAPVLAAAERFRWLESVAYGALLVGTARLAARDLEAAGARLDRALEVSRAHGFAGARWEAHAALAALSREQGRPAAEEEHLARAAGIVERLAAGIDDDALAAGFRARALAQPPAPPGPPPPRAGAARD